MTYADEFLSPPVNHTISRRRLLKMGAIAMGLSFAPGLALAGTRGPAKPAKPVQAVKTSSKQARSSPAKLAKASARRTRSSRVQAVSAVEHPVVHPAVQPARAAVKWGRSLDLYNVNTKEYLQTVYWANGRYLPGALRDINYFLRDHHSDEVIDIDPQLLDLLYTIGDTLDIRQPFYIVSAYRSPSTNAWLRMFHSGIAENSLHMEGRAVDIRLPGSNLSLIRRVALDLQAGGVGYYPGSNFIHVDTGRVRSWSA